LTTDSLQLVDPSRLSLDTFFYVCHTPPVERVEFTLGDVVRKLRDRLEWSGPELAEKAGVNKETIVNLENNPLSAKQETIAKIAAALGVTEEFLRAQVPSTSGQERTIPTGAENNEGMVKLSRGDGVGIAIPYGSPSPSSLPPPVVNTSSEKGSPADAERPSTPAPPLSLEERDALFNEQYSQLRHAYAAAGDLRIELFNIITAVGPLAVEIDERRRKAEESRQHRTKGRRRHRASGR
jgi:transcriptional regulator with XRE-family HTH domain